MTDSYSEKPTLAAVLFDLDGTLIDTAADFHRIINILLRQRQLPEISYKSLLPSVSNGAKAMIEKAFGDQISETETAQLHQQMLALYEQAPCVDSKPYPGIESLLSWLAKHSIPWGIVTNKPWLYTQPLMEALQLTPAAGSIICPDHLSEKKPHPEGLLLACNQMQVAAENCAYIGDHIRDIEAGNRANMHTVAALYGYLEENEDTSLWQHNTQIQSATELPELLSQHFNIPA